MYKFIRDFDDQHIEVSFSDFADIWEVRENFISFLLACGYQPDTINEAFPDSDAIWEFKNAFTEDGQVCS